MRKWISGWKLWTAGGLLPIATGKTKIDRRVWKTRALLFYTSVKTEVCVRMRTRVLNARVPAVSPVYSVKPSLTNAKRNLVRTMARVNLWSINTCVSAPRGSWVRRILSRLRTTDRSFSGGQCETERNECEPVNPCMNAGRCIDRLNNFSCVCNPGQYEHPRERERNPVLVFYWTCPLVNRFHWVLLRSTNRSLPIQSVLEWWNLSNLDRQLPLWLSTRIQCKRTEGINIVSVR